MSDTFPSVRYGPDGQSMICNSPAEVPNGWEDHPGKVKEHPLVEAAREFAKFDPDGDGRPGGSKPKPRRKAKRRAAAK